MATSTPIKPTFKPFVPATETRPELTARALILGGIFVLAGAFVWTLRSPRNEETNA